MKRTELFHELLNKFRFVEPVADDIQDSMVRSRERVLRSSLKEAGEYSAAYGFVLSVYFTARKAGLRPSIAVSKLLAVCLVFMLTGAAAAGIFFSFRSFVFTDREKEMVRPVPEIVIPDEPGRKNADNLIENNDFKKKDPIEKEAVKKDTEEEKPVEAVKKYRLGVTSFKVRNMDPGTAEKVGSALSAELVRILGSDKVVVLEEERKGKSINRLLVGTVTKLGKRYYISAKVVDAETSEVFFGETGTVNSVAELEGVSRNIAKKIAQKIE
ncbi:MAG: hypothetical protein GY754_47190 [bacterium]|nr:hypothetical protein [bacterium]